MLIKKNKEWNNYKNITPEKTFINRRSILKSMGFAAVSSNIIIQNALAVEEPNPRNDLYPVDQNREFNVEEFDIKGGLENLLLKKKLQVIIIISNLVLQKILKEVQVS